MAENFNGYTTSTVVHRVINGKQQTITDNIHYKVHSESKRLFIGEQAFATPSRYIYDYNEAGQKIWSANAYDFSTGETVKIVICFENSTKVQISVYYPNGNFTNYDCTCKFESML